MKYIAVLVNALGQPVKDIMGQHVIITLKEEDINRRFKRYSGDLVLYGHGDYKSGDGKSFRLYKPVETEVVTTTTITVKK